MIVHLFALGVPAVVAPLGARLLGRRRDAWASLAAAAAAIPTFFFGRGALAAVWVLPWLGVASSMAIREGRRALTTGQDLAVAAASVFLAGSAASLVASRFGLTVGRLGEPIIELTAVHYGVAGYGATLLALSAVRVAAPRRHLLATAGLASTVAAPPIVALGFLTAGAVPQVGGAVLLASGVLITAFVTAVDAAPRSGDRITKPLLLISAASPVAPMALAVLWAAAQHWLVPALDIPSMARIHGTLNFAGFVVCGLVGYRRLFVSSRQEVPTCS